MSDLYTRPDDLRSDLREGTRTGNWFQDTFTDAVTPGVTLNRDGSVDRQGLAWWAQLLTPGAEKIAKQRKAISDAEIIDNAVIGSNLTDAQILAASGGKPLTTANVRGVIADGRLKVGDRITPQQQAVITRGINADNISQQQVNANIAQMGNTGKRLDYQIQLAEMKDARDRADSLEAKAEARRDRLDLLDRQDHRYSQEMQRYDKRRQKETIQSLIAGLASLGAAFAM